MIFIYKCRYFKLIFDLQILHGKFQKDDCRHQIKYLIRNIVLVILQMILHELVVGYERRRHIFAT